MKQIVSPFLVEAFTTVLSVAQPYFGSNLTLNPSTPLLKFTSSLPFDAFYLQFLNKLVRHFAFLKWTWAWLNIGLLCVSRTFWRKPALAHNVFNLEIFTQATVKSDCSLGITSEQFAQTWSYKVKFLLYSDCPITYQWQTVFENLNSLRLWVISPLQKSLRVV